MSTVGIIGAMEVEVETLKKHMKVRRTVKKAHMEFCEGVLGGKEVVVVRSGIGKVNAAVCTQILVDDFKADTVINTGIAGSLKAEINIGDIVVSTDLVHHDMDAVNFGYPLGQIPQMDTFIADKAVKNRITENFQGYCTEMEGAAIAQAAYLNDVPFVVLRAISDKADDSASMDYPTFDVQAAEHCVKLVEHFLELI